MLELTGSERAPAISSGLSRRGQASEDNEWGTWRILGPTQDGITIQIVELVGDVSGWREYSLACG